MQSSAAVSLLAGLVLLVGCEPAAKGLSPEVVESQRQRFKLAEEPADPVTPLDLRESGGAEELNGRPVVLVGQIGGVANPYDTEPDFPFKAGEATLFLVDPSTAAEMADHMSDPNHAEECAFCKARAKDKLASVATVTFVDEQGKTLPVGAQELLAVKAGDVVVIEGEAKILPSPGGATADQLVVTATGLYVRE